jgi:hypothetical protein
VAEVGTSGLVHRVDACFSAVKRIKIIGHAIAVSSLHVSRFLTPKILSAIVAKKPTYNLVHFYLLRR